MPATETPIEITERERVQLWRAAALEKVGYGPEAAAEIAARHDIDLHLAIELFEQGCPPDTALRILL